MLKRFRRSDFASRILGRCIGLYLTVALRTSRWIIEADAESWPLLTGRNGQTAILVTWHEHLPLGPPLYWRARDENPSLQVSALISRHRDGRMIAGIMRRWGIASVGGSSAKPGKTDKGGAGALRGLLGLLRQGTIICLTPDGPRGPRRTMQPGAAYLAALSGVGVVPVAAFCRPCWRIRSWDRMALPIPFSRGTIRCGSPIRIGRHEVEAGSARIARALEALDTASGRA